MAIEKLKYIVTADTKGFSGPMKAIGALAVTAFVAAIKVTADFEKQLSKLRGVSGATEEQMASLEKQSRGLGKTTAFTAREVASAQVELAKLGFTTDKILNSTGGILDLAAGLGVSLGDAAQLAGSTLRQFGLDSTDMTQVVDILSKSTTESALDFNKLQESLKIVAPIAKTVGLSLAETTGILETLANAGLSGSTAGTSLRKAFIDLNAAGIPLNEALSKVKNSSDKLATAVQLVGKRAATAFVVLAENGYNAVTDFDGSANKLRETMEDNLIGDFDKLTSAVTELGTVVGQANTGWLRDFTQGLTNIANDISEGWEFDALIADIEEIGGEFGKLQTTIDKLAAQREVKLRLILTDEGVNLSEELDIVQSKIDSYKDLDDSVELAEGGKQLSKYFKSIGIDINSITANLGDYRDAYASARASAQGMIDPAKQLKKLEEDKKESNREAYQATVKGLEDELQAVKKVIALGPFQNKSELDILGLKLQKNTLEQELSDNVKTTNKLLIQQAILEAKIVEEKGKRGPVSSVNAGLKPAGITSGPSITTGSIGDLKKSETLSQVEQEVQAYQNYLDQVQEKNALIEQSFSQLGQNIATSLGASGGIFGAFVGTLIQGLLQIAAQEIISSATVTATSATKVAAYSSVASAAAIAGAAAGAAAAGPAAPILLPILIGAGLAAVAAAFSGLGGSKASSGGGSSSSSAAVASSPLVTPSSTQGSDQQYRLVSEVRGQDLRLIMQRAGDSYDGLS